MVVDIYTHIFSDRFFCELERGSQKIGNIESGCAACAVQPGLRLDKVLFAFRLQLDLECLSCQSLLVGRTGVARNLRQRAVTGDGFDFVGAASGVCQSGGFCLAQTME